MKQKFSKKWKASKQPRKQRKYLANAPLHIRRIFLSSNLSEDIRKKHNRRSFSLRKGDKVKVMRGKFKGKEGKVNVVNLSTRKVSIEGLQIQKKDGTKVNIFFHPSNLQIQELNLEDKKRIKSLGKGAKEEKSEKKGEINEKVKKSDEKSSKKTTKKKKVRRKK
jgi:large subunit ribosomal protein L24